MELPQLAISKEHLPDDYRTIAAERFNIKPDTVGRIASGSRKNPEVFSFLLDLAEQYKQHLSELAQRVEKLNQPITPES